MSKSEHFLKICLYYPFEIMFITISTIFCYKLNSNNSQWIKLYTLSDLDFILYDNAKPIKYFLIACLMVISLFAIIVLRISVELKRDPTNYKWIILAIISNVIQIIFIILIIHLIKIPVLQRILTYVFTLFSLATILRFSMTSTIKLT